MEKRKIKNKNDQERFVKQKIKKQKKKKKKKKYEKIKRRFLEALI